jgi:hypothetical protein
MDAYGFRVIPSEHCPENTVFIMRPQEPWESMEGWMRSIVVMKNVGLPSSSSLAPSDAPPDSPPTPTPPLSSQ